jgi:hypothetical protein
MRVTGLWACLLLITRLTVRNACRVAGPGIQHRLADDCEISLSSVATINSFELLLKSSSEFKWFACVMIAAKDHQC